MHKLYAYIKKVAFVHILDIFICYNYNTLCIAFHIDSIYWKVWR